MIIEAKIFFTCIIVLLVTIIFARAAKDTSVSESTKTLATVLFLLSSAGIVISLLMAVWR